MLKIITADAINGLQQIENEICDTCITSPPYYGLRQYLPTGSMVLRKDLTQKEIQFVQDELEKVGVKWF